LFLIESICDLICYLVKSCCCGVMRFETMLVLDVRRVLDYTGCAKKK